MKFFLDITFFYGIFYFFLISIIGYGFLLKNFFRFEVNNYFIGFFGIIAVTIISYLTIIFVKHGYLHNLILHLIGFFVGIFAGRFWVF